MSQLAWSPVRPPERRTLAGRRVRLDPLDPGSHAAGLYALSHAPGGDPSTWDWLGVGPFATREEFDTWLASCARSADPLFLTIVDPGDGAPLGMAAYLRIDPANGVIEIGHIWFGPALRRSAAATEAIYLLARSAFDDLGYRRLEWKCDAGNEPSRRAALRFGFEYEGVFRQHMVVKGRNRDTAWYAIVDRDWPRLRRAFEAWLDPSNFDDDGVQRRRLAELRG
jgi:RimJ/RimL family protein N-acetyltransferase